MGQSVRKRPFGQKESSLIFNARQRGQDKLDLTIIKPKEKLVFGKTYPGFSRYMVYHNGKVISKATNKEIMLAESTGVKGYRLTNDQGKRAWLYPDDIIELFKNPDQTIKGKYQRKNPERKVYNRLTKEQINEILALENPKQVELSRQYNVHESTISRIINQKTRIKSYFNGQG